MSVMSELHAEGNTAFYEWEKSIYGENSPLSDHDREMFISGYAQYYLINLGGLLSPQREGKNESN